MSIQAWLSIFIFLGTLLVIASGKLKMAAASLLGATLMLLLGLIGGDAAVAAIDHNTIGLLIGMMIVVSVLSKTGMFQFLAVRAIKVTKGRPVMIFWIISLLTAFLSAFLDNVTTVLLITPVVLSLCDLIAMDPRPLLFMELFASNIGGTGTLIGDPPNMIVSSVAGFSFNDFIFTAAPVALLVLFASTFFLCRYYKAELVSDAEASERLREVDEYKLIVNKPLMIKSVIVVCLVLAGFTLHGVFHVLPSVVALSAAGVMLAVSYMDEKPIIHDDVEWPTLIYFVSLFVMAGALRETGAINAVADALIRLFNGKALLMILSVLWISGITCTFVNNIAYSAIFVQIIAAMAQSASISPAPLYWALAFGACFGGNGTYFGAAANAVIVDFAHKEAIPISFGEFLKTGMRIVFISLLIATAAILIIAKLYI